MEAQSRAGPVVAQHFAPPSAPVAGSRFRRTIDVSSATHRKRPSGVNAFSPKGAASLGSRCPHERPAP